MKLCDSRFARNKVYLLRLFTVGSSFQSMGASVHIPRESDHLFRRKATTRSDAKRPPIPI